jgi:hypothetical protein
VPPDNTQVTTKNEPELLETLPCNVTSARVAIARTIRGKPITLFQGIPHHLWRQLTDLAMQAGATSLCKKTKIRSEPLTRGHSVKSKKFGQNLI